MKINEVFYQTATKDREDFKLCTTPTSITEQIAVISRNAVNDSKPVIVIQQQVRRTKVCKHKGLKDGYTNVITFLELQEANKRVLMLTV